MESGGSTDKRDSRGSSISSTPPTETGSGPSGVMRRRGSLFDLVTGRESTTSGRSLSGSDNAINTRHRLDSRFSRPSQPLPPRRVTNAGVTIVRPTKEARKAEIVAAVTRRLYTARKKPDPRAELPPSLSENAEEADQIEPKELKLCSNARARLQEISKRALALGLHRRLRKDSDTQTEEMSSALRVKEKSVSTDEPTKEVAVETTTTASEANLVVDFGKRVKMAEKSAQWKAESASIGTQASPFVPPICHILQPPSVYGPPFWLNNWWPNLSWGTACCHHEPKRRANISVDSVDDFSDDSLESLCGISRVGPDGPSGDTVVSEPKPALWETLTLRSGKQFKENSSLYQPDMFRTHHPLASIFQKGLSYLGREDKSTETDTKKEMDVDEKGCNTEPPTKTADEESQTTPCPAHHEVKPNFRLPSFVTDPPTSHFQIVCDFTVACNSVTDPAKLSLHHEKPDPCCSCDHPNDSLNLRPVTATPEVFQQPTPSVSVRQPNQSSTFHWPKTPFSTPDIIAQASNDSINVLSKEKATHHSEVEASSSENRSGVGGLAERIRDFVSLDHTLLQSQQSPDPSGARSLDSIFLPKRDNQNGPVITGTNERPNSSSVKKFRLPCLSEMNAQSVPASVTVRSLDESSSPSKHIQSPAKRITPSSFLSPKGRRLLLTWLNNPGSNPSTATSTRSGRKTFNGRVSRRHVGFREKHHRRTATKRTGTADIEKVSIYHNLSLLLSEATNYVRTITPNRPVSGNSRNRSEETQTGLYPPTNFCEVHSSVSLTRDAGTQSENYRTVSLNTDPAVTAEKAVSTPERLTTSTQCALNFSSSLTKKTNTFALFWISRSTQTDVSMWNDTYLLPDDILLEAQSMASDEFFYDPVPYFLSCPKSLHRPVDIYELIENDEFRPVDRYDSSLGYCGRNILCPEFTRSSRLPCQHSSPRAYLQHLVSLRRGIVEACQSPPARPTGVG